MSEELVRILAAVAASGVFAYPFVGPTLAKLRAMFPGDKKPPQEDAIKQKMRDIEIVLSLSARLAERGCKEGVDLCQKLTEVLLKPVK